MPLAVSAGANVLALSRMLGHANPSVTLDIYADLFDDDLEAVADRLEQLRSDSLVAQMRPKPSGGGRRGAGRNNQSPEIRGLWWVGDTGIEPVTPAV
jgi:hypothetical protein